MIVYKSKNTTLVGLKGIIVQDLSSTFIIAHHSTGKLKHVPKHGTLFNLYIHLPSHNTADPATTTTTTTTTTTAADADGMDGATATGKEVVVRLFGTQFCGRVAERSSRKWKGVSSIDL